MNATATATAKLSYKELQAALKELREQGKTSIKLNSKQEVLQEEYERITAAGDDDIDSELVATAVDNGYCELTCGIGKDEQPQFTTRIIPAMNPKVAPPWLCKPYVVYIIDGIDYFPYELDMQLKGQVCELPPAPSLLKVKVGAAVVNERKLAANLPPRLQVAALKDRVSKARPVTAPIVNPAKDLPKVAVTFKAQEDYNPYFIDTAKAARYSKTLGDVEKQAARNLEDGIKYAASTTKRVVGAVIDFGKGFHKAQVKRALKAA